MCIRDSCTGEFLSVYNPEEARAISKDYVAAKEEGTKDVDFLERTHVALMASLPPEVSVVEPAGAEGCPNSKPELPQNYVVVYQDGLFNRDEKLEIASFTKFLTTQVLMKSYRKWKTPRTLRGPCAPGWRLTSCRTSTRKVTPTRPAGPTWSTRNPRRDKQKGGQSSALGVAKRDCIKRRWTRPASRRPTEPSAPYVQKRTSGSQSGRCWEIYSSHTLVYLLLKIPGKYLFFLRINV